MKTFTVRATVLLSPLLLLFLGGVPVSWGQMQVESLDRGLIAVRQDIGYFVGWRLLGDEPYDTGFHVYRNGTRITGEPLYGATHYVDRRAPSGTTYTVSAVYDGEERDPGEPARKILETEGANAGYFDIPLQRPPEGPRGGTYSPNDASAADLTGDGKYEIVLKWDPSNSKDNAHSGHTDSQILDAYTLDGEHLWRIDLGRNIRAGAHYTQFLVYDFDGDGRAEMMVKTAPGTRDGSGRFLSKGPAARANHRLDYSNDSGRILEGPEFLTVFDGRTGEELDTTNYVPGRGDVSAWGDNYGNRSDRFLAGVAYLDGERPSAVFCRGYYTRMTLVAWDWRDGELTRRWYFDTDNAPYDGNEWTGQGNHQLSVADANGDGRHDIIYGSAVIGSDGEGLHTTGLGHGDALHVAHMIKDDPIPRIWMPHESGGNGVTLRDADSGDLLFQHEHSDDVGRGVAAELDSRVPGFKFWASSGLGLYDLSGDVVGTIPSSANHVIWWDGSLSRELLDRNHITKWSVDQNEGTRLLTAEGADSNNGTKANPSLQADLFGDWREEVVFRTDNNENLRVYTTTMGTNHRLPTLMHDPVYRVAVAWQNVAYNQPPHPGYYLASDMDFPPSPSPIVPVANGEFGQIDDFQDGTTMGWRHGISNSHEPRVISHAGPDGDGDHALAVSSSGGSGPGSMLVMFNRSQWTGDFLSEGITAIHFDLRHESGADASVRVALQGPGGEFASASAVEVSSGTGWASYTIGITPEELVRDSGTGTAEQTLASVQEMRLLSSTDPAWRGDSVAMELHFDNIEAGGAEPDPLAEWREMHFEGDELENEEISGPSADPDRDGLPNLLEFVLLGDPRFPDLASLPAVAVEAVEDGDTGEEYLTLTFTRRGDLGDVGLAVETAGEPGAWQAGGVQVGADENEDGTVTEVWRDDVPQSENRRRFMRLGANLE